MKELPLMYLLNNASVYCQQTQHSLLVSGLLSVLRCNWRRKVGVLLLGDNSESNTSGLCVALHTLYHLIWSYLLAKRRRKQKKKEEGQPRRNKHQRRRNIRKQRNNKGRRKLRGELKGGWNNRRKKGRGRVRRKRRQQNHQRGTKRTGWTSH